MSTQLKCDHCKAVKAEGLKPRSLSLKEGDQVSFFSFSTDLCDECMIKLVTAMQNFLKVKPTLPEAKTTLGSLGGM